MVRLRLTRMGQKKRPFYRLVAADSRAPRDGRFIEQLGYYDPMRDPIVVKIKMERVNHWLSRGAQPSETAERLIKRAQRIEEIGEEAFNAELEAKKVEAAAIKAKAEAEAKAKADAEAKAAAEAEAAEAAAAAEAAGDAAEGDESGDEEAS